jgi:hypothetical protein
MGTPDLFNEEAKLGIRKEVIEGVIREIKDTLVIFCAGGCGKTTDEVNPVEFWQGKVEISTDPEERVPIWTCKECMEKKIKAADEN